MLLRHLPPNSFWSNLPEVKTKRRLSAVHLSLGADGNPSLKVVQLERDVILSICGSGMNEQTIKVAGNGEQYYVFLQDVWLIDEDVATDTTTAARGALAD